MAKRTPQPKAPALLRQARRTSEALRTRPATVDPDQVVSLVRRLEKAGRRRMAFGLARLGTEAFPDHAALWAEAGAVHASRGRSEAAVRCYGRAIALEGNKRRWVRELASVMTAAGASPGKVDKLYREAIASRPDDTGMVRDWVAHLERCGRPDVIAELLALQRRTRRPIPAVLHVLLTSGEADQGHRELLAKPLARFLRTPPARSCATVWDSYCRLEPLDPAACAAVMSVSRTERELFFLAQPPRSVRLDEAETSSLPLDAAALRFYAGEFQEPDLPPGHEQRDYPSETARELQELQDSGIGFQTKAVRDRRLVLRDPHTGAEVVPFDTVTPSGRTVYSFGDRELSMLVTGGGGNKAMVVLLPRERALLDLGSGLERLLTARHLASLLGVLLERAARLREEYGDAVVRRAGTPEERSVVLLLSNTENFAHHLWNFFPGFERIVDHGLAGHVDEIRHGGSEFFGTPAALFPEFATARFVREERETLRDPYPFSTRHLILQPGGYFIRKALVQRVVERMQSLPSGGLPEPPPVGDRPFPVVWIGLRVGSRSWVNQERAVPRLIDEVLARHPEALFLLDGYSYPVGHDLISDKWRPTISQLHGLASEVRANSQHPDRIIDMVGNTLRESVLWAAATDVYLAPNGTTQHKVGWLTTGPGVCYGPPSLADSPPDRRPGAFEAEGRPIPISVIGPTVSEGRRRGRNDSRPHFDNVRLDFDEVLTVMLDLIARRKG